MKHENLPSITSNANTRVSRRTGDHPTVIEAARLSTETTRLLPTFQKAGLTKTDLQSVIQIALDLVDADLGDDDDFCTPFMYRTQKEQWSSRASCQRNPLYCMPISYEQANTHGSYKEYISNHLNIGHHSMPFIHPRSTGLLRIESGLRWCCCCCCCWCT